MTILRVLWESRVSGRVATVLVAAVNFLSCKLLFFPQVRQFYLKQQKRREALEQRDQERLANLRSVMEEQARRDRER